MKTGVFKAFSIFVFLALPAWPIPPASQPISLQLACGERDCTLLTGVPQTSGMRSGFVRLKPGESVGVHSTEENEESLIVLRGKGQADVVGQSAMPMSANMLIYIPPQSRHDVKNTGDVVLEYVYIVSPVAKKP